MATIDVYQGYPRTLILSFSYEDGTPLNVSGWGIFLAASQTYGQPPLIYVGTTGAAPAVTGLVYLPLTSGNANHCVGDYNCDLLAVDLNGIGTPYHTDGLRILPTTFTS